MTNDEIPAWFHNVIVDGMEYLYLLQLPGAPAADSVVRTTGMWINVLYFRMQGWSEQDAPRILAGFRAMAGDVPRWPAPSLLHQYIPKPKQAVKKFEHVVLSKEEAAQRFDKLRKELKLRGFKYD